MVYHQLGETDAELEALALLHEVCLPSGASRGGILKLCSLLHWVWLGCTDPGAGWGVPWGSPPAVLVAAGQGEPGRLSPTAAAPGDLGNCLGLTQVVA